MLEKIEIGKEYISAIGDKVTVLFIGETHAFVKFGDREVSIRVNYCLEHWSEIPTPKKRYWLWDVKSSSEEIFKASTYMDENGVASNNIAEYDKDQLIKKHENEFIEV